MTHRLAPVALLLLIATLVLLAPTARTQEAPAPDARVPVGSVVAWHNFGEATARPPAGWQLCDGSPITDPWFVANVGKDRHTPNLNGASEPASGASAGQARVLRGALTSPVDGYAGSDRAAHDHAMPHRHGAAHEHDFKHRHGLRHRHRVDLRTSNAGGRGRGGNQGFGGTRTHSHDVRGQTGDADRQQSEDAVPGSSGAASRATTDVPDRPDTAQATVDTLPAHFGVTYIIKIRP